MKLEMDSDALDDLLRSMYRLPHRPVLHLQDQESCKQFVNLIVECLKGEFQKDEQENEPAAFSSVELGAIKRAISIIESQPNIQWLPQYGSIIVAHHDVLQVPGMMTVTIIGLDRHSFFLHDDGAGGYSHEADALDYKILVAGTVDVTRIDAFLKQFQQLLSTAKQRDGDLRTAAGGRQGHQFTPSLIHALATQAINCPCSDGNKCKCPNVLPKGGFTDVGRHTGGEPRNTSFALAKSLIEWSFVQCGFVDKVLFQKALLCVHLCILADRVLRGEDDSKRAQGQDAWKVRADLDVAFRILEIVSVEGTQLYEGGTSIDFIFEKAKKLRLRIDEVVKLLAKSEVNRFILPDVESLLKNPGSFRSPRIHLEDELISAPSNRDYDDRIKKNIGPTKLLGDDFRFDLATLLTWLQSSSFKGKADHVTVLLRLRTVERVFWNRALHGFDTDYLDDQGMEHLVAVVNEYRSVFQNFEGGLDRGCLMITDLRSRELLVVWIAYCLAFAAAKHRHSDVMSNVGVALSYNDLEHLVLSDRVSWNVVAAVATFLKRNFVSQKSELFSFRSPATTFLFAESFARSDPRLRRIWNAEKNGAESRMDKHWESVVRKKEEAARLRSEISELRCELARAERDRGSESLSYSRRCQYDHYACRSELDRCQAKVNSLNQKIGARSSTLNHVLKAPTPVCQPLPRGENTALRWLFFLHMPITFRVLSTLTLTGQQMLVPRPWKAECDGPDGTELVDVFVSLHSENGECLTKFYSAYQRCEFHTPQEQRSGMRGDVALVSPRPIVEIRPKTIGPTSVDGMYSREDGVWFPDNVPFGMEWTGGSLVWDRNGGVAFDPFQVPRKWAISYFTEKLPAEARSLQWAMRIEEDADTADQRGNRPLACQETRPHWLSKTQFLTFCRLRGFPCRQLRDVVCTLSEQSLPFQQECVHILIKQALFHIGKLSADGRGDIHLGWKHDLTHGDLLVAIKSILAKIVDEISESPSSYLSALLVGDIAGFLSDWDGDMKVLSRRLANKAVSWAKDFGRQAESAEKAEDSIGFRVQQRLLLSISILCLTQGPMSEGDICLAIKCRAISKNVCVDEGEASSIREKLSWIERHADSMVAHRIKDMLQGLKLDFLTDAVGAVIAVVPTVLRWRRRESSSSSFVATGSDGCVYAINVLTGTVLVNGLPPSSLPCEILEHKLYERTFGNRNFEVVSKNEVYETIRRVKGFLYRFALKSDGSLHVLETSPHGEILELLDGTENGIEQWAAELPMRLKRMHGHWFFRKERLIILRGKYFFDRDIHFMLHLFADEDGLVGNCRVVPAHLRERGIGDIFESAPTFSQLALHDSDLLTFFEKFEHPQFVHFIIAGDESSRNLSLSVKLPRYGLTFDYCDGDFQCAELSGFVLTKYQQLEGSLFGFERYLVLRKGADKTERRATSILVADGDISHSNLAGSTVTKSSEVCDDIVRWHKYDVHPRFRTLSASTVSSRLFLAALHASTSFLSPDPDSLLTGFERAVELVRGSWVARVLSPDETASLLKLRTACKGRHSSLSLLCTEVMQSSMAVPFLHTDSDCDSMVHHELKDCSAASEKYLNDLEDGLLNCRNRLTPSEERRVLGQCGRMPVYRKENTKLAIGSPPLQKNVGRQMEDAVRRLVHPAGSDHSNVTKVGFPLLFDSQTALEEDIMAELRASWEIHRQLSTEPELRCTSSIGAAGHIAALQFSASHWRWTIEDYILSATNDKTDNVNPSCLDLQRLSGLRPRATLRDLLMAVLRKDTLSDFNASMSEEARHRLKDCIVEWLRLCVVEDKLLRLFEVAHDDQGLQRELRVVRNWDPSENLAWLVFEVEHCLQIWPEQATVARHLINNSGDIVQLNMGMGKTRVIIPLLILHWTFHRCSGCIPRINILPSLLSEACDFFHQRLTASIFNIQMVTLPFCRDVQLDSQMVAAMTSLLNWCATNSGFVVVAPEHRLSLGLKIKELELDPLSEISTKGLREIEALPWIDILDESDELLHQRFRLIYAIGSVRELPSGPHRWCAAQALLGAIHGNQQVGEWIKGHQHFAAQSEETATESFRSIQITSRDSMVKLVTGFCGVLAEAVLSDPPHELEWVKGHSKKNDILDSLLSADDPPARIRELSDDQRNDVLALRGLLVGGILVHCLQKRHRVDFGVARPGKKKLSVPFRGADTPSLRSEFSHPDCAIVFTILAYYDDGLSEKEVIIAFETLFTLGRNVQRTVYSQWYSLSKDSMDKQDPTLCDKLDSVEKIDLANRAQLRLLVTFYRKNVKVVNFWLNSSVFPEEMQYYPQRLSATSWNLAQSRAHILGFSGTNDNHRLLPRQVKQYFPDAESSNNSVWQSLAGTNGRMLEILMNRTTGCLSLGGPDKVSSIIEMLQNDMRLQNAQAIIDAGAFLAGHSNESLARKMIEAFTRNGVSKFKGVVFFDNRTSEGQWMALEPSGRLLPKNQSPVQEAEAFAIFDEPRCRGSDLKLNKTATALLTIGPRMCKDKLMQAAGRLRALAQGQSLVIAGTEFLFNEILESAGGSKEVTTRVILEWTLRNSVRANVEGLFPWADQGLFFSTSQNKPELSVEEERLSLNDYYGGAFHEVSVSSAVEKARAYHTGRVSRKSSIIEPREQALIEVIVDQTKRYGESMVHSNSGMDEECERELELELEIEEEKEVEIPRMVPLKETDWDKSSVLEASCPGILSGIVEVVSICDFVSACLRPRELSRFAWSDDVYGTSNFFKTVAGKLGAPLLSINHYLRMVDAFLVFPNNQVLLVSERETDELIKLFWTQAGNESVKVTLAHLSVLRSALDGSIRGLLPNSLTLGRKLGSSQMLLPWRSWSPQWEGPSDAILATLQLLAGETVYRMDSRREALKEILRGPGVSLGPAVADPALIIDARGNSHMFQYSDLEDACRKLAREEQQLIQEEEDERGSM